MGNFVRCYSILPLMERGHADLTLRPLPRLVTFDPAFRLRNCPRERIRQAKPLYTRRRK